MPDRTGWLADRAVLAATLDRFGVPGPAVICPVSVRCRTAAGPLADDAVAWTVADVLATRGLVVEVRCLPAVLPV